jgi:hypothetical protein
MQQRGEALSAATWRVLKPLTTKLLYAAAWAMPQTSVATGPQPQQQFPDPAHAQSQFSRCLFLGDVWFLNFVEDLHSIPLFRRHPQPLS